ncbi:MAG: hybrid sensor histidine kinase/response regulator, partial [Myxococcales bacterium]|nr:hybrid sensor histidine kinase/response regulator [Myxococcales bacterium]
RSVLAAAHHLQAIVDDVLDLTKIEAGKLDINAEVFPVIELVENLGTVCVPLARRGGNTLKLKYGRELGYIRTDRTKLNRVLLDLLSNACKFTHEGTIAVRAGVVPRGGGEWLEIEVRDSGIGIPDDRLEELFEPFRQADESTTRKYGGTGLGLAITRSFCELMGGSVEARSIVGVGSTFVVRLPREVAAISSDG